MEAARRLRRDVAIATGTLAELYRGAGRNQALDALLARESGDGLLLRDTDRVSPVLLERCSLRPVPVPRCSRMPIPSPSRLKQAAESCRPPIRMTSADWQRRTEQSLSSHWPTEKITRVRHADPDGPAAKLEVPPPGTPPRRGQNHQTGTHPQGTARTAGQTTSQADPARLGSDQSHASSGLPLAGAGETGEAS